MPHRRTDSDSSGRPSRSRSRPPPDRVAVLDVRNQKLMTLKRATAEHELHEKIDLPRWKSKKSIYLPEGEERNKEYIATVHLLHLGFGFNFQRMLGAQEQLYVLKN